MSCYRDKHRDPLVSSFEWVLWVYVQNTFWRAYIYKCVLYNAPLWCCILKEKTIITTTKKGGKSQKKSNIVSLVFLYYMSCMQCGIRV